MTSQAFSPGFDSASGGLRHLEVLGVETSDPLLLKAVDGAVTVGMATITTGAKVQFTISTHAEIEADTALWYDWASGSVTANTLETINGPVTGVRGVSTGAATFSVIAQRPS